MLKATLWTPLRAIAGWLAQIRLALGEPGVRCGMCDTVPPPGERLCYDCQLDELSAP